MGMKTISSLMLVTYFDWRWGETKTLGIFSTLGFADSAIAEFLKNDQALDEPHGWEESDFEKLVMILDYREPGRTLTLGNT